MTTRTPQGHMSNECLVRTIGSQLTVIYYTSKDGATSSLHLRNGNLFRQGNESIDSTVRRVSVKMTKLDASKNYGVEFK